MTAGRLAIPVFEGRVSPRLDCASRFLLLDGASVGSAADGSGGLQVEELYLDCRAPHGMAHELRRLGVEVVICGGLSALYEQRLRSCGLTLISWVSGPVEEIIAAYRRGTLRSGQRCPQNRQRRRGRPGT